jgi:hypothetical protein
MKSILEAKELAVIEPEALVFLKTEIVLPDMFETMRSGLLSPSTSQMATPRAVVPAVKSIFAANEVLVIDPPPANVTLNGLLEYAVNPFTVTEIGWYIVPTGTVTVSEVEVAAVTVALTAPK